VGFLKYLILKRIKIVTAKHRFRMNRSFCFRKSNDGVKKAASQSLPLFSNT
jgi:hypothetical protein